MVHTRWALWSDEKKLATVIVGLFSLKEKAPTKKTSHCNSRALFTRKAPTKNICVTLSFPRIFLYHTIYMCSGFGPSRGTFASRRLCKFVCEAHFCSQTKFVSAFLKLFSIFFEMFSIKKKVPCTFFGYVRQNVAWVLLSDYTLKIRYWIVTTVNFRISSDRLASRKEFQISKILFVSLQYFILQKYKASTSVFFHKETENNENEDQRIQNN